MLDYYQSNIQKIVVETKWSNVNNIVNVNKKNKVNVNKKYLIKLRTMNQ